MKTIRRWFASFVIWSIEQHINDLQQVMRETNSMDHYRLAMIGREQARKELAKARSDYNATLPVGQRRTWGAA